MADESIIVEQPVLDYETVDIIENDDTAQIESETLDIIEVDDIQVFTVETDEAFSSLGKQNEEMKHQYFNGRDLPDQHPITAITGLRAELDSIEALQTIYSDDKQAADYYEWEDGNILLENRIGYFVSICDDIRTIKICTGEDIFGVTVDSAAFIGGQDDIVRDNTYGLVAHTGIVNVRCELDVEVGDYVISNNYGMAAKADNNYGCKVIALHNIKGVLYSTILLNMSIDQMNAIGQELIDFNYRMDVAETNIVTAINTANRAYDLADDIVALSQEAVQKADDAVHKSDEAISKVDSADVQIQEAIKISTQAQAIAESAVVSAETIRSEAVATANETLTTVTNEINTIKSEIDDFERDVALDVDKTEETIENLSKDINIIKDELNEVETNINLKIDEVEGSVEELSNGIDITNNELNNVKNNVASDIEEVRGNIDKAFKQVEDLTEEITPLVEWTDGESSGVAGFVAKSDNNATQLTTVVQWKDDMTDPDVGTIAMINQKVSDNESNIDSLAVWKSSVEKDVSSISSIQQTATDNKAKIENLTSLQSETTESIADITQQVTDNEASITNLTTWKNQVANPNGTLKISETIAQINQIANENEASIEALTSWQNVVANEDGTLKIADTVAQISQKADANESNIASITQWKEGATTSLANVEQKASDNEASIKNLVTWKDATNTTISSIQQTANANKLSIESLTSWKTETNEAIADVQQQTSDNEASINSLTTWKGTVANEDGTLKIAETVSRITQQSDSDHAQVELLAAWKEDIGDEVGSLAELQAQANENSANITALTKWQSEVEGLEDSVASLAGMQVTVNEHTAQINNLAELQTKDSKALTDFQQKVVEDYATITSVAQLETDMTDSIAAVTQETSEKYATITSVATLKTETEDTITDAIADIKQEVSDTYATIKSVNEFKTQTSNAITGVKEEAAKTYATIESVAQLKTDTNQSLADFKQLATETYATIESVTSMETELNTSIVGIEQKADANGASIQSFVSNVEKYSVGETSQAYGLSVEQAQTVLEKGMIYAPTEEHTETYDDSDYSFIPTYYYTWDGTQWVESGSPLVNFSDSYVIGNNIAPYWYIPGEDDVTNGGITYESHTLYQWRNNQWIAIATLAGNVNNRKITLVRQTTNGIAMDVSNAQKSITSHQQWLDDNSANIQDVVSWKSDVKDDVSNIATIKSQADSTSASIAQVVEAIGKDGEVNAASIITAVNNDDSAITLNANKINLNGAITANGTFTIDESGYMTTTGGTIASWHLTSRKLFAGGIIDGEDTGLLPVCMQVPTGSNSTVFAVGGRRDHMNYQSTTDNADDSTDGKAVFYVRADGYLMSQKGKIGGWNIGTDRLSCSVMSSDNKNGFAVDIAVPTTKGNTGNTTTVMAVKSVTSGTTTWPFVVRSDGTLTATKANITGTITATSGKIGGWNLSSTMLYKDVYNNGTEDKSTICYRTFMQNINSYSNTGNRAFGVYKYTRSSTSASWTTDPQFYVNNEGMLYAKNAEITGKITATSGSFKGTITTTSGKIGGWTINTGNISGSSDGYKVWLSPYGISAQPPDDTVEECRWYDLVWEYSDKRVKNSINPIEDDYEGFYNDLKPVIFKYNENIKPEKYDQLHFGFIAQDIVKSIEDNQLGKLSIIYGDKYYKIEKKELIALNTWQIQKAKARISDLEARVAELEAMIKGE